MTDPQPTPVLDRVPVFDQRSRDYPVRQLMREAPTRRKRMWSTRAEPLDQGREGACVGFAWSGELAATPVRKTVDNASALALYHAAQTEDRAMGHNYTAGASVLAGAKACKAAGSISSYHWAFGINDVIDTLVAKGPVVLGINWHRSMYYTNPDGLVTVDGPVVGGHAILAVGYWPNHPEFGTDVVAWFNSWGPTYGRKGTGYIRVADLDMLLQANGEACIATDTRPKR